MLPQILEFFIENAEFQEFSGKKVLEVGSRYVNGSVRPFIERWLKPDQYIGVDIELGRFVDVVLPAERLIEHFGSDCFDVVVSTELIEHVQDWRLVIANIKAVLKPGGTIYLTSPSKGFPYHGWPCDFWRYEMCDVQRIFSDFDVRVLERYSGSAYPSVFFKGHKPAGYTPNNLDEVSLYSVVLGERTDSIPSIADMPLPRKLRLLLQSQTVRILARARIYALH